MNTTTNTATTIIAERDTDELLETLSVHEQALNACTCSGKCGSDNHKAMFFAIVWHLEAEYDVDDIMLTWDTNDGRTYAEALTDAIKAVR